ncbi:MULTISPECIES: GNAT family N-acetyltransferase [unclassified Variovorax]|uniref:GNAT family N-acetyltransferase n=1 Tax=unclassified Variovorax TaxID=663243 RepID=UPI000D12780A|nr:MULTISPECIES: GNAT family N-acyltransferase [unclassified Variovorax]AVQ85255.1 ornithine-acyl-ACP acyltransferase [Variovorax sp. PMC12]QRY34877.1 GNAT family N-acetyltransferase [Variovorax sp. PDNC026]
MQTETIAPHAFQIHRPAAHAPVLETRWADCEEDLRDAQRLRFRVFAQEMGAHLAPPEGTPPGLDADRFDPFCDHLLVRAIDPEHGPGPLIGTYRVLTPDAARRAGGFYTDTEFDLTPLMPLRGRALELGRSCVDAEWRSGSVIMALWTALGQYMVEHRLDTMIGCASIGMEDHGLAAARLWHRLCRTHLVEQRWRVEPRIALPLDTDLEADARSDAAAPAAPPLIKGYLRCGARLLGPPALDAAFNTADLPLMLRLDDIAPRYRQHFFGVTSGVPCGVST